MEQETIRQLYLFCIFMLNGIVIGILFDIFRILRRTFKTPNWITYIEDILFWVITGIFLIYTIFIFNNGEIRNFIFLGLIAGGSIYLLFVSKYFIKINVTILTFIKKIIYRIAKIIFFPISKIIFLITKVLKKLKQKIDIFFYKMSKITEKRKKANNKVS